MPIAAIPSPFAAALTKSYALIYFFSHFRASSKIIVISQPCRACCSLQFFIGRCFRLFLANQLLLDFRRLPQPYLPSCKWAFLFHLQVVDALTIMIRYSQHQTCVFCHQAVTGINHTGALVFLVQPHGCRVCFSIRDTVNQAAVSSLTYSYSVGTTRPGALLPPPISPPTDPYPRPQPANP